MSFRSITFVPAIFVFSTLISSQAALARPSISSVGKSTITLCAPTSVLENQMKRSLILIRRRVRHGFRFRQAVVSLNGNCIVVSLPHSLGWIRWLADDLASQGHFGIGVAYPNSKKALASGQIVRYKSDPVTSTNSNLPVIKVALGRPAFVGFSAKLVQQAGFEYVGVRLTPKGSRALCAFTKNLSGGLAVVVLDRQVITDEQVTVQICGGKLLTGFPKAKTLDKPLGPRELIADLHSGIPLPVPFTVFSIG